MGGAPSWEKREQAVGTGLIFAAFKGIKTQFLAYLVA
jgi:hypothetical protein